MPPLNPALGKDMTIFVSLRRNSRETLTAMSKRTRIPVTTLFDKMEIAIERVIERVRQGGHYVPEEVIRRRYEGGWKNFNLFYKRLVDYWLLYDNSRGTPVLLSEGQKS
jgi:hypothetical protein